MIEKYISAKYSKPDFVQMKDLAMWFAKTPIQVANWYKNSFQRGQLP